MVVAADISPTRCVYDHHVWYAEEYTRTRLPGYQWARLGIYTSHDGNDYQECMRVLRIMPDFLKDVKAMKH
jgi:hypothetical protein